MEKKIVIIGVVFLLFLLSCNEQTTFIQGKNTFTDSDTIFLENQNKVDTIFLLSKERTKSIWINQLFYKKECGEKKVLLAYCLSDENFELIENLKGVQNRTILGKDILLEKKHFKNYELIKIENKSTNSGSLIKSINTVLLKDDCSQLIRKEFTLLSDDNGETFDKRLELITTEEDSLYYTVR